MKKSRIIYFLFLFIALLALGKLSFSKTMAQTTGDDDAIAIRVVPNPEHYSPMHWYQKQGFNGKPELMTVDGYPAVRDGRTAYVNVANISKNNLYTNIYLISYTQEGNKETSDIFSQILNHWRFNTNLTSAGQCFNQEETDEVCLVDSDCSGGGLCDSLKAEITRDTERLGDVVYLREKIDEYKYGNGNFPKLESGTYLSGKTISTWPSWSQEFSRQLGISIPSDPVNKMGDCGGSQYDKNTCWDDENKTFPDDLSDGFDLPAGSNALVYEVSSDGQNYSMCAYMESGLVAQLGGDFGSCTESIRGNNPPTIDCGTLLGFVGESFIGYVTASDIDGDPIDISVSGLKAGFSSSPESANKRVVIKNSQPTTGTSFKVTAKDTNGDSTSKTCSIVIESGEFITYPITEINALIGSNFGFTVYANHSKKDYKGIDFVFSGTDPVFHCSSGGLMLDGRYKCEVNASFNKLGVSNAEVYAVNSKGEVSTTQKFKVNIYNDPPIILIPLNCDTGVRLGVSYKNCQLKATDPNGHSITGWSLAGNPTGMSISQNGLITGKPTVSGVFTMTIAAFDQYNGRSVNAVYTLEVNDYCGDGKKQQPNMEGSGGRSNDGYEDCDGTDGTPTPAQSNFSWQYGCETNCRGKLDGYCGDGATQKIYGEECDDGNTVDGDGCNTNSSACSFVCGDGKVTNGGGHTESCDFGSNINCCKDCDWTDSPTDWLSTSDDFKLNSGDSRSVPLPDCLSLDGTRSGHEYCRGVLGGTFDATFPNGVPPGPQSGMAIVFITDLSGSQFDVTYAATKLAMEQIIKKFYKKANDENANMHVGLLTTFNCPSCVEEPFEVSHYKEIPLGNLLKTYGGKAHSDLALNSIDTYKRMVPPGDQPDFGIAYARAHKMLNDYNYDAQGERYIIILTDGYMSYSGKEDDLAKADDIQIYTIAFSHFPPYYPQPEDWVDYPGQYPGDTLRSLCQISSDNGNTDICFTNNYSRIKPTASTNQKTVSKELDIIFGDIMDQIVSRIPKYYINDVPYDLTGNYNNISFPLSSINCDITGANPCSPASFSLKTVFAGGGQMRFNDFKFNVITPCED